MEKISKLSISLLCIVFFVSCDDDETAGPQIETGLIPDQEMISGGTTRFYDLYLPSTYNSQDQLPLLIDLHGATLTRGNQRGISGFEAIAERENFVAVFPSGLAGPIGPPINMSSWRWNYNAGDEKDFDFLESLIDQMIEVYGVDPGRVYLTGFSMGGIMSYAMACKMSNKIAAIGVVAGGMTEYLINNCNPSRSIPVMHIHGTDDLLVPYEGTTQSPSIEESILFWANKGSCGVSYSQDEVPDSDLFDNSNVLIQSYCDQDEKVELVVVEDGGHNWPGSSSILFDNRLAGNTNNDIDASEMMWEFLKKHSNPDPQ